MIWLQLTANSGPAECCLALAKALAVLELEARAQGVAVRLIEQLEGPVPGTFRSVLLELEGGGEQVMASRWTGSILWVCESPYRKMHKRKNWFVGGSVFAPPAAPMECGEIRYEATRASGPGGQHVNKTDSAIRATHVASGLSVKVQTERSQHANKRIAGQLLASKLADLALDEAEKIKSDRRMQHFKAERGNAARVFVGLGFVERL